MQPHIQKAYTFLEEHLPNNYVALTQAELKKSKIKETDQVIRNVRTQITTSNIDVINALLKVAKAHQKKQRELSKELQKV